VRRTFYDDSPKRQKLLLRQPEQKQATFILALWEKINGIGPGTPLDQNRTEATRTTARTEMLAQVRLSKTTSSKQ